MTRINLIDPSMLIDSHLRGEYREITRVFTHAKKHVMAGRIPDDIDIPLSFRLGKGHETFFFDKIRWVLTRYQNLYAEMGKRGFRPDLKLYNKIYADVIITFQHTEWFKNWTPKPQDYYLSMSRICMMSNIPSVNSELYGE